MFAPQRSRGERSQEGTMQRTVPISRNGADRVPGLKGYPIVGNLP